MRAECPAQGGPEPAPLAPCPPPSFWGPAPLPLTKLGLPPGRSHDAVCATWAGEAFPGTAGRAWPEGESWSLGPRRSVGRGSRRALSLVPVGAAPVATARPIAWWRQKADGGVVMHTFISGLGPGIHVQHRHVPLPTASFPAESCPPHLRVSLPLLVRAPALVLSQTPSEGTVGAPFPTSPGLGWTLPTGPGCSPPVSSSSLDAETPPPTPSHQQVPPRAWPSVQGEQKPQQRAAVRGWLTTPTPGLSLLLALARALSSGGTAVQPPGQPTEATPPEPPATARPHGDTSLPRFLGRRGRPQSPPCPGTCQDSPPRAPGIQPGPASWSRADPP